MSTTVATTVTSLDGFHATPMAQRADELARAFFDAVNADDPAPHGWPAWRLASRPTTDRLWVPLLMNNQVTPYSGLPNGTVRAANGINCACRDTDGHEGNRALGIRGAIAGARGLLLAAGAACGVLVRATTAGPLRSVARRCRSHDRCPRGACTDIQGRYP
jgi:hypothetical protein